MKGLLITMGVICASYFSFAQTNTWASGFGTTKIDNVNSAIVDGSGNTYVVGDIEQGSLTIGTDLLDNSLNQNANGYLAKYNSAGQAQWGVFMDCLSGGSVMDIDVDAGGNVYVVGVFTDSVELNSKGTSQMAKTQANYIAAKNFYVAKYNSSGLLQWFDFMQSTGEWDGRAIAVDGSNNVYVSGSGYGNLVNSTATDSVVDLTNAVEMPFLAKWNSSGTFVDVVNVKTAADNNGAIIHDMKIGIDGNIVLCGSTADTITFAGSQEVPDLTNTLPDAMLLKFNTSLGETWATLIGGEDEEEARSLVIDDSSKIWITGSMENSFSIGSDVLNSNGGKDILLAKIDSNGAAIGGFNIGGLGLDHGNGVTLDASNKLWVTGQFTGVNVDFDPDAGTSNLSGGTGEEAFLASYSSIGAFYDAMSIGDGASTDDIGKAVYSSSSSDVFVAGYFSSSSAEFNPNGTSTTITNVGDKDAFIAKYNTSACPVGNAVSISGSTKVCMAGRTAYTTPVVAGATTYNWTITGDPQTIISGQGTRNLVIEGTNTGGSTIEVTPSDGFCSGTKATLPITVYANPTVDNIVATNSTCGNSNGEIQLTMNGAGPFTYIWSNGDTTSSPKDLKSGSYYLTAKETSTGCSVDSLVSIFDNGAPTVDATSLVTDLNCANDESGAIDLVLTGGKSPYKYAWSNGDTTASISGLQAGGYRVVVSDSAGCGLSQIFVVNEPQSLSLSTNFKDVSTCGGNNGEVSVTASNGTSPYGFLWSNADTMSALTGLPFGSYLVTVTDKNGCMDSTSVKVSETGGPTLTIDSVKTVTCKATDGGVYLTGSHAMPITYSWSNSTNNKDLTGVDAGVYTVTATAAGCSSVEAIELMITAPMKNEICILTVDDSSKKNLCAFERAQLAGVDHYNYYRESWEPGKYIRLGSYSNDSVSYWIDPTADPKLKSWKYKLSAVNECGMESELSDFHKSIHLVLKNSDTSKAELQWSNYEGFSYNWVYIDRFTDTSDWVTIDSVLFSQTSYTDVNPPLDKSLQYAVGIDHPNGCFASRANSKSLNSARSNRGAAPVTWFGSDTANPNDTTYVQTKLEQAYIKVFPNPTDDNLTVEFAEEGTFLLKLLDLNGKTLFVDEVLNVSENASQNYNFSEYESGIYLMSIQLQGDSGPPNYIKIIRK
ncbi:MAG: T9SS type A sorting domain-containing protein [Salibacteraceae bacterium]